MQGVIRQLSRQVLYMILRLSYPFCWVKLVNQCNLLFENSRSFKRTDINPRTDFDVWPLVSAFCCIRISLTLMKIHRWQRAKSVFLTIKVKPATNRTIFYDVWRSPFYLFIIPILFMISSSSPIIACIFVACFSFKITAKPIHPCK